MGVPDSAPLGAWSVQTLKAPGLYSREQLERAVALAQALHFKAQRGRLILVEKPNGGDCGRG